VKGGRRKGKGGVCEGDGEGMVGERREENYSPFFLEVGKSDLWYFCPFY
jgi:hypothetical protein